MLIDESIITVSAGKGGDGSVHFRREKYVPRGGPDGGDGGGGGSVYLVVSDRTHGLNEFVRVRAFKAEPGQPGARARRHGKDGNTLELHVPVGTLVHCQKNADFMPLADLTHVEQRLLVARGGKGGRGNVHFATATQQVPHFAQPGFPGEHKTLKLTMKLIADVGIIGLPNVGKSSLLKAISNAQPKIADYQFTTLEPYLGVVRHNDETFVAADIPGLIEGAAQGKGLGHKFLKHIERTRLLVHLIDAQSLTPEQDEKTIQTELQLFSSDLASKPSLCVLSRADTIESVAAWKKVHPKLKIDAAISSATRKGIPELLRLIAKKLV